MRVLRTPEIPADLRQACSRLYLTVMERALMDRERLSLNGSWKFMVSSAERLSAASMLDMASIRVPSCWESELPGLVAGAQMAWYQRTFFVPASWLQSAVVLHFGAVNYLAQVYLNGELVGEHEGGYTPFCFRVERRLQEGENLLEVAVTNPAAGLSRFPHEVVLSGGKNATGRMNLDEIPYGKQSWYGSGSGIWQGVWIESRPLCHVDEIVVTPDVDRCEAHILVRLSESAGDGQQILVDVTQLDPLVPLPPPPGLEIPKTAAKSRKPSRASEISSAAPRNGAASHVATLSAPEDSRPSADGSAGVGTSKSPASRHYTAQTHTSSGVLTYDMVVPMLDAHLWSPDSPIRYRALVTIVKGQSCVDALTAVFGMRKIEARDGRIWLNNKEIYLIGALDQDFYPGTLYIPPSEEFLEDQLIKAKEMGLNLLRCHIKVPDPRYLAAADRLGLLVWYEIPNWWTLTESAMGRAQSTIEAMIKRDFNHPCLIIRTIVNEDWGTNVRYSPVDRQWLKAMYHYVKQLDPTRLVVDNSACEGNLHVQTDIEDFHFYCSIPDHCEEWRGWVRDFSSRARWTFTQFGDAARTFQEPLVVSEFGNWGLPSIRGLRETYGTDPSWMTTGRNVAYPYGTERRYSLYKLDSIFGSYDEFAIATQWHQFRSLKFEIEEMRRRESIVGYVITEFTDIHWECNGLLDMVRGRKAFHDTLKTINSPDILLLEWSRLSYWSGENIRMPVYVSHYSGRELKDGKVEWNLGDQAGRIEGVSQEVGSVRLWGSVEAPVPTDERPQRVEMPLRLIDGGGETLSANTQEMFVFPARMKQAPNLRHLWVYDPRDLWGLRASLGRAGYRVSDHPSDTTECAVVTRFDDTVRAYVRDGGKVLCLAKPQTLKAQSGQFQEVGADLFENGSIILTSRERRPGERITGKQWDGNWATNFNWLKFKEVCPSLVAQNPLGFEFLRIMPDYVILGFEAEDDFLDIYSGMVVGWVHNPVAMLAGVRCGAGKTLISTFKLEEAYETDPAATVMMHDLIEFVVSDRFRPKKEAAGSVRMTALMRALAGAE